MRVERGDALPGLNVPNLDHGMPSSLSGDKHAAVSAEAQEVDALGVSEQVGLGSIARVVHRHDGVDGVRDPASVGRCIKQNVSMGKQLEKQKETHPTQMHPETLR